MAYVQDKAVLFTTDGYYIKNLTCGTIPDVLTTVDFGPGLVAKISNISKIINFPLNNTIQGLP